MYYPEPFIASPTFINDDIWFLHITIYQYWLWFIFISLIVFFFLGFLITLRWCNIRHRPARETRGVSRSKCGDLITATVPVSWAASIIIHESTDAIEFADGFGSTDVAIGIRAYQWGWEYYYPKGLNLSNELNDTTFMGDSLLSSVSSTATDKALFKSAHLTSDFLTSSVSTNSLNLLSLTNAKPMSLSADATFGNNKLIARQATNLLESNGVLNPDQVFAFTSLSDSDTDHLYASFKNFVWENTFSDKPHYVNHQFSFFSAKANFYNAMTFLNWRDWTNTLNVLSAAPGAGMLAVTNRKITNLLMDTSALTTSNCVINTLGNLKSTLATRVGWNLTGYTSWGSSLVADQDFKRWAAFDLLDDLLWVPTDWLTTNQTTINQHSTTTVTCLDYNTIPAFTDFTINEVSYPFSTYQLRPLGVTSALTAAYTQLYVTAGWVKSAANLSVFTGWKDLQFVLPLLTKQASIYILPTRSSIALTDLLRNFSGALPVLNYASMPFTTASNSADWLVDWRAFSTYFNAFWKVFKPLLDEQRGTFFGRNFSNTGTELPVLGQNIPTLLGKVQKNNLSAKANLLLLRSEPVTRASFLSNALTFQAMPFFSFPFNLSFESDSLRYAWFDWYSVRNSVTAKALDTSVFNLHAARDYSVSFNPTVVSSNLVNQYENYFLKYSHARKFYLPINLYSPFFRSLQADVACCGSLYPQVLFGFSMYLRSLLTVNSFSLSNSVSGVFSWSAATTSLRPFSESLDLQSNQISAPLTLMDIESRRLYLTNSLLLGKTHRTGSTHLRPLLAQITGARPAGLLTTEVTENSPLISQYQPLRKGIVNMIRIQADRAIAMPTDTRLQILAVSKDIIHSWAIPAAGIKIDCIPGYSSHRVAIFTLSGIYWGQCMEICGRFHHWMPIVVYFLRRDLFCLWCIHFIFKNNQTNSTLQSLTHQTADASVLTSYRGSNVWAYL